MLASNCKIQVKIAPKKMLIEAKNEIKSNIDNIQSEKENQKKRKNTKADLLQGSYNMIYAKISYNKMI